MYAYVGNAPLRYIDPFGLERIPYPGMVELVNENNPYSGPGRISNELLLCITWSESSHDPETTHESATEVGLGGITEDATTDASEKLMRDKLINEALSHDNVGADPRLQVQVMSAYLRRYQLSGGSIEAALTTYRNPKPGSKLIQKIQTCEKCLNVLPGPIREGKCPPSGPNQDPQQCLNKIHP